MNLFAPFRACVVRPDRAGFLSCPPYDVVDEAEARRFAALDDNQFMRVIRSETQFETGTDPHNEAVYARAREALDRLGAEGLYAPTASPVYFVYALENGPHRQIGLLAAVSLAAHRDGRVKPHELTRPDKENDRARHIAVTGANTGLVYLAYRGNPAAAEALAAASAGTPLIDFVAENGVRHRFWVIGEVGRGAIESAFSAVGDLYVADGHHRLAASARVWRDAGAREDSPTAFVMAAMFPHDELRILPYHRLVKDWGPFDEAALLERIAREFEVREAERPEPDRPGEYGLFVGGRWRRLTARIAPEGPNEARLDVAVLQERLLARVCGIENPRTDPRIAFVGGVCTMDELAAQAARYEKGMAVACYATSMDDLLAVADAGAIMPPKSTWFEPKLRSGVVVRRFEDQ